MKKKAELKYTGTILRTHMKNENRTNRQHKKLSHKLAAQKSQNIHI